MTKMIIISRIHKTIHCGLADFKADTQTFMLDFLQGLVMKTNCKL